MHQSTVAVCSAARLGERLALRAQTRPGVSRLRLKRLVEGNGLL